MPLQRLPPAWQSQSGAQQHVSANSCGAVRATVATVRLLLIPPPDRGRAEAPAAAPSCSRGRVRGRVHSSWIPTSPSSVCVVAAGDCSQCSSSSAASCSWFTLSAHWCRSASTSAREARAGVVDVSTGRLLATRKQAITTWSPLRDITSSPLMKFGDACANCVRGALKDAGIDASSVVGVGFDATCSLVCLDADQHPIGTDPTAPDESEQNVILWMDHRATPQADIINAMGHERLSTVGGTISPEMEVPKMSWLRENMPDAFSRANSGKFLDLADYLAYRATDYVRCPIVVHHCLQVGLRCQS